MGITRKKRSSFATGQGWIRKKSGFLLKRKVNATGAEKIPIKLLINELKIALASFPLTIAVKTTQEAVVIGRQDKIKVPTMKALGK
jgi:hypothetical protein